MFVCPQRYARRYHGNERAWLCASASTAKIVVIAAPCLRKSRRLFIFSEYIFQSQLNGAVAAFAGDPAERSAGRIGISSSPIRMIVQVEQLRTELQAAPFRHWKVLANSQIPLPESRIPKNVAWLHPKRA